MSKILKAVYETKQDMKGNNMKQEPVAWMTEYATEGQHGVTFDERLANEYGFNIPLYTAPRELSDEEIWTIFGEVTYRNKDLGGTVAMDFARAILKKASEK